MPRNRRRNPYRRMNPELVEKLQQKIDGKPHSGHMGFDHFCEHCHIVVQFMDTHGVR